MPGKGMSLFCGCLDVCPISGDGSESGRDGLGQESIPTSWDWIPGMSSMAIVQKSGTLQT